MLKRRYLKKKDSLRILKNALIPEIKDERMVDFLVLLISNAVHGLVPASSTEQLFKDSVRKAIVSWKETSENQNLEELKLILVKLFVKKTTNRFIEFTNKNTGPLLVISIIVSVVFPTLNIIFC